MRARRHPGWFVLLGYLGCLGYLGLPGAAAFDGRSLDSVVSVLPLWPGHMRGGSPDTPPGSAPEGSAVAVLPGGYLATSLHVGDRANLARLVRPCQCEKQISGDAVRSRRNRMRNTI